MKIAKYFFTEAEVTLIFNVNRITIWRWIRGGRLNSQKIGREVIIPKWEVELLKVSAKG